MLKNSYKVGVTFSRSVRNAFRPRRPLSLPSTCGFTFGNAQRCLFYVKISSHPALKRLTGVSLFLNSQKYTPPHCFFLSILSVGYLMVVNETIHRVHFFLIFWINLYFIHGTPKNRKKEKKWNYELEMINFLIFCSVCAGACGDNIIPY